MSADILNMSIAVIGSFTISAADELEIIIVVDVDTIAGLIEDEIVVRIESIWTAVLGEETTCTETEPTCFVGPEHALVAAVATRDE